MMTGMQWKIIENSVIINEESLFQSPPALIVLSTERLFNLIRGKESPVAVNDVFSNIKMYIDKISWISYFY